MHRLAGRAVTVHRSILMSGNSSFTVVVGILAAACAIQTTRAAMPAPVMVAPGVYALLGAGGDVGPANDGRTANAAFVVGPRGVVVFDTGISYREGEQIIAAVESISKQPIRLAVLTHPSQEAIFGAAAFQARGIPVLAHRRAAQLIAGRCETCLRNLRSTLGEEAMTKTRVAEPDRLIDGGVTLTLIGRPLRLIAPQWSSAPGAIAAFDERTSTLIAGNLVTIGRVPDMRDARLKTWRRALAQLGSTRCRHLIPGYGPVGSCADIDAFAAYLAAIERRVQQLLKENVSLAEIGERCELPQFAGWDQYPTQHPQNAHFVYLDLERAQFE